MNTRITLKTLPDATAQQVFDHIAKHMLTQNAPSMRGTSYAYRDADGLKCPGGCVIGDDEYDPDLENTTWFNLMKQGKVPREHAELIQKMQKVHDSSYEEDWPELLLRVADKEQLDPHVIKELTPDEGNLLERLGAKLTAQGVI